MLVRKIKCTDTSNASTNVFMKAQTEKGQKIFLGGGRLFCLELFVLPSSIPLFLCLLANYQPNVGVVIIKNKMIGLENKEDNKQQATGNLSSHHSIEHKTQQSRHKK